MSRNICAVCGKDFYVRPSVLAKGHGKMCSKKCKGVTMLGNIPGNAKHLMSRTPTFRSWESMLDRCKNQNGKDFSNYGGRGILVCERWLSFDNFFADMGERPKAKTIGRIDNEGNYEPSNCRWEDATTQSNNRRSSRYITANGTTKTIAQWAKEIGVSRQSLRYRIEAGWSPENAINFDR